MEITKMRELIEQEKIIWTNHVVTRLLQRKISQSDVKNAILNGNIIEEYENDYPYPSCLVYGISLDNKILHVVCGFNEESVWIITAYYPSEEEWNKDMKTRKGKV